MPRISVVSAPEAILPNQILKRDCTRLGTTVYAPESGLLVSKGVLVLATLDRPANERGITTDLVLPFLERSSVVPKVGEWALNDFQVHPISKGALLDMV